MQLLLCDPPYGSENEGGSADPLKAGQISGDTEAEAADLLRRVMTAMEPKLASDAHCYIFVTLRRDSFLRLAPVVKEFFDIRGYITWVKGSSGRVVDGFALTTELIIFGTRGGKHGAPVRQLIGKPLPDVVIRDRVPAGKSFHQHQKPLELLETLIAKSTLPGELVADPLAGSGSTLWAAKETGRAYWGVELKKKYHEPGLDRLSKTTFVGSSLRDFEDVPEVPGAVRYEILADVEGTEHVVLPRGEDVWEVLMDSDGHDLDVGPPGEAFSGTVYLDDEGIVLSVDKDEAGWHLSARGGDGAQLRESGAGWVLENGGRPLRTLGVERVVFSAGEAVCDAIPASIPGQRGILFDRAVDAVVDNIESVADIRSGHRETDVALWRAGLAPPWERVLGIDDSGRAVLPESREEIHDYQRSRRARAMVHGRRLTFLSPALSSAALCRECALWLASHGDRDSVDAAVAGERVRWRDKMVAPEEFERARKPKPKKRAPAKARGKKVA